MNSSAINPIDIVTFTKRTVSGIPLSGLIMRKFVRDWEKNTLGKSYGGIQIFCAARFANIDLIEKEYMSNAAKLGQYTFEP